MSKKKPHKNGKPDKQVKPSVAMVKKLEIKRHFPTGQRPIYSNHFVVQHEESTFQFMFFEVHSPLILEEGDEARRIIQELKHADAECVARVVVPAHLIPSIINALSENFQKHQAKASGATKLIDFDGQSNE